MVPPVCAGQTPMTHINLPQMMAIVVLAVRLASCAAAAEPTSGFHFKAVSDRARGLWEGEQPVLVYNHGLITKPDTPGARGRSSYIHPVYGLNGEILTDDFPKDHLYHRGLFWAWPHIKIGEREYDLWSA